MIMEPSLNNHRKFHTLFPATFTFHHQKMKLTSNNKLKSPRHPASITRSSSSRLHQQHHRLHNKQPPQPLRPKRRHSFTCLWRNLTISNLDQHHNFLHHFSQASQKFTSSSTRPKQMAQVAQCHREVRHSAHHRSEAHLVAEHLSVEALVSNWIMVRGESSCGEFYLMLRILLNQQTQTVASHQAALHSTKHR